MDLQAKRIELAKWVLELNDDLLVRLDAFKSNNPSDIIAYSTQGKPLTKEQYIRQIKEADDSISAGEYTTVEDLEKEVQNW